MKPLRRIVASVLSGTLIGLVGAVFLVALRSAASARVALILAAGEHSFPEWLVATSTGLAGAVVATWLAYRFVPDSPQIAVPVNGRSPERHSSNLGALTANFAGTSLAVGAGFALGPERPAIQMGASIGRIVGRILGLDPSDLKILMAVAGGAGVATVFNSPLGCAAYTVEAVITRASFRISGIALGLGGIAVAVTRLINCARHD